jgi:Leucine-rich repeat (LRR) protein
MKKGIGLLVLVLLLVFAASALAAKVEPIVEELKGQIAAQVDLTDRELTLAQMIALKEAYPDTEFAWKLNIYEKTVTSEDTYFDAGTTVIRAFQEFHNFLKCFPKLEKVDMFATNIRANRIFELDEMFPNIEFGWTMHLNEHYIRTDATAFSTLHSDRSEFHSSKDFAILKFCKNLKALDLGHNKITNLDFLAELTDIRVLILAINQIVDITPLQNLTKLEYIELFMNRVEDITPLAALENLQDLELTQNRVKDFSPLYGLKNLRRLWLRRAGSVVPRDEISPHLPDCFIDYESTSTGGTWRKHSHYIDIYYIFNKGIYREWTPADENRKLGE